MSYAREMNSGSNFDDDNKPSMSGDGPPNIRHALEEQRARLDRMGKLIVQLRDRLEPVIRQQENKYPAEGDGGTPGGLSQVQETIYTNNDLIRSLTGVLSRLIQEVDL